MDDHEKRRARRLLGAGHPVSEVARRMDMNPLRIYRLCAAEGIRLPDARKKLPDSIAELRKELVAAGSVKALADKYGVTRAAVYWRLSKARREQR